MSTAQRVSYHILGKFGKFGKIVSHSPIKTHQFLKRFSHDLSCGASCINDGTNTLQPALVQLFIAGSYSMSILNYFKLKAKMNHPVEPRSELPNPNGPLSSTVPPSTIIAVNKKLSSTMEKSASRDKS